MLVLDGDTVRLATELGQDFMPSPVHHPGAHALVGRVGVDPARSGWTVEAAWILRPEGPRWLWPARPSVDGMEVTSRMSLPRLEDGADIVARVRGPDGRSFLLRRRAAPVLISG